MCRGAACACPRRGIHASDAANIAAWHHAIGQLPVDLLSFSTTADDHIHRIRWSQPGADVAMTWTGGFNIDVNVVTREMPQWRGWQRAGIRGSFLGRVDDNAVCTMLQFSGRGTWAGMSHPDGVMWCATWTSCPRQIGRIYRRAQQLANGEGAAPRCPIIYTFIATMLARRSLYWNPDGVDDLRLALAPSFGYDTVSPQRYIQWSWD